MTGSIHGWPSVSSAPPSGEPVRDVGRKAKGMKRVRIAEDLGGLRVQHLREHPLSDHRLDDAGPRPKRASASPPALLRAGPRAHQ
jgi:hypothetical protein